MARAIWVNNATASHPVWLRCLDAARPIALGAAIENVEFQNYGDLAFIYRDNVKFQKRAFDVDVTTFEYLYGYTPPRRVVSSCCWQSTDPAARRSLQRSTMISRQCSSGWRRTAVLSSSAVTLTSTSIRLMTPERCSSSPASGVVWMFSARHRANPYRRTHAGSRYHQQRD